MTNLADVEPISHHQKNAEIIARLERLPVTGRLQFMRITIGIATFFDAYTVLAIAFALPQRIWLPNLAFTPCWAASFKEGQPIHLNSSGKNYESRAKALYFFVYF